MPDREESREEWEKEIIDVQHSVTFPEALRSAQIIAKNSASPAPVQDFPHLVRLLLSGILLVIGFVAFSANVPHNTALGVAALAVAWGLQHSVGPANTSRCAAPPWPES
jgi:hypothetical protein